MVTLKLPKEEQNENEIKPTKTNPKKSHPYIQVRVKPREKEEWIRFVNEHNEFTYLSELVRFCVREYIEKGFKEEKNENLKPVITDLINVLREERKEYIEKIDQVLESNRESKGVKIERKHKERVLKLLEKHKYTSEDIADIFGLPEKYIIDVLNELIDQGLIKLNKNLNYELVNHEYKE
jgi:predicted HTH transcriptional regulator